MSSDLHFEMRGSIAVIRLNRPAKRNALGDALILALRKIFETMPSDAKAAVIYGAGDHFCAGLDLSELKERDAGQGLQHSRMVRWWAAAWSWPARAIFGWLMTRLFMHYLRVLAAFLSVVVARFEYPS